MRAVSIGCGSAFSSASFAATTTASASDAAMTAMPGLVQNCPAPMVSDPAHPAPIRAPRAAAAAGSTNIGLVEPSSPQNGIGSSRPMARSKSARPPESEPVNPTALIAGCVTSACAASRLPPCTRLNVPAGMPQARSPRRRLPG